MSNFFSYICPIIKGVERYKEELQALPESIREAVEKSERKAKFLKLRNFS